MWETAKKLLNLAIEKVIPKSFTYAAKVEGHEKETVALKDKISKTDAKFLLHASWDIAT